MVELLYTFCFYHMMLGHMTLGKKLLSVFLLSLVVVVWVVVAQPYFQQNKLDATFVPRNTWASEYFSQKEYLHDGSYARRRIFYQGQDSNAIFVDPTFWHYGAEERNAIERAKSKSCWNYLEDFGTFNYQTSLSWQEAIRDWLLQKLDRCYVTLGSYAITQSAHGLLEKEKAVSKKTIMDMYQPSLLIVVGGLSTISTSDKSNVTTDLVDAQHHLEESLRSPSLDTASAEQLHYFIEKRNAIAKRYYDINMQYATDVWKIYFTDKYDAEIKDIDIDTSIDYFLALLKEPLRKYIVLNYPDMATDEYSRTSANLTSILDWVDAIVNNNHTYLARIFVSNWDNAWLEDLLWLVKKRITSSLLTVDQNNMSLMNDRIMPAYYSPTNTNDDYLDIITSLWNWHIVSINDLFLQHTHANIFQKYFLRKDIITEIDSLYYSLDPYVEDQYYYYAFRSEKERYIQHLRELLY